MKLIRYFICVTLLMLVACATTTSDKDTIATLRHAKVEIKEVKIEGGLEKAMMSYQRFIEESPDSALTPEAIRRLADLKIEKEYGSLTAGAVTTETPEKISSSRRIELPKVDSVSPTPTGQAITNATAYDESETDFENRSTQVQPVDSVAAATDTPIEGVADLERAGTREAIALYEKLINDYPEYGRNDQVFYQMSRAYEELGQVENAMEVMDRMVVEFPQSRYIDEVQFRRAEYFFVRKRYLDAEDAYSSIVRIGSGSHFYELALYKLGWTFYKQELYEEALHRFIALLDHKVSIGYDFDQTEDEQERKRMDDAFRVVSLSFSSIGGADSIVDYFSQHGKRVYEDKVYSNLGEFYFDKRRYADAAETYNAFVDRNQFHKVAPNFQMRVIEIQAAGGFPSLVLDSKKKYATTYGLTAEYWKYFNPAERPEVLGFLKTNLTDLANHYHACYQDPKQEEDKPANFEEALHWYREFLSSFPADVASPVMNYQLANLLLENKSFGLAALEFEKTSYDYPLHENSSQSGYAAVAAYREQLANASSTEEDAVKHEVIRSSLKFAETFPEHEKASIVLGAAADDLYGMKDYEQALAAASKLIEAFPDADTEVTRDAWVVVGHSSYELMLYSGAETAYLKVLELLPVEDESRDALIDNLAASIYKQGEQANAAEDYRAAADHFLRVGQLAPTSTIRPNAEYDAAAALIQLKDWEMAASVLVSFRNNFPDHLLQAEVTKKIAYVYRENNQLALAADEYERIEQESQDEEIRREALLVAADLHEQVGNSARALEVYRRYISYFPQPVELNLETRNKVANILKTQEARESYLEELEQIVSIEAAAGDERTPRTRYLAAQASLVLAEREFDAFIAVKLVEPFEENLQKKRGLMKIAIDSFNRLVDYEIGETTAAATYYLAEIYADFSKSLMTSERPEGLSPLEEEQYELAIEEQAYPFEEKAIEVHESNLMLISRGVYNEWVKKSLQKLAKFVPARYDKPEAPSGIASSLEAFVFEIERPVEVATSEEPNPVESAQSGETGTASEPVQGQESVNVLGSEPMEAVQTEETEAINEPTPLDTAVAEGPEAVEGGPVEAVQTEESVVGTEPKPMEAGLENPNLDSQADSLEAVQEAETEDIAESVEDDKPEKSEAAAVESKIDESAQTGEAEATMESETESPRLAEESELEPGTAESGQAGQADLSQTKTDKATRE